MTAARSSVWLAVACAVATLGASGCRATTYSAPYAVAPVLLGPVSCIGCRATSQLGASSGEFDDKAAVSDVAGGSGSRFETDFSLITLKAGLRVPDACVGDIHVERIHVISWAVDGLIVFGGDAEIEVSGRARSVARGRCGPRPWPYAGPRGIVPFDWPDRPPSASVPPPIAPAAVTPPVAPAPMTPAPTPASPENYP